MAKQTMERPAAETQAPPEFEFMFKYTVEIEPPLQVIAGPHGTRMTAIVKGGTVSGPALTGRILPGGGDWLRAGTNATGRLDSRITFEAEGGALIHSHYSGVVEAPPDVFERMEQGEDIPEAETYFRSAPLFETADEEYAWLNKVQALGIGALGPNRVTYRVFRVL